MLMPIWAYTQTELLTNGVVNDGTDDKEPTTQMNYIFTKVTSLASMVNDGQYIIGANVDGTIKVAQNLASNKNFGYLNTEDAQEVDGKITLTSKANTFAVKGTDVIENQSSQKDIYDLQGRKVKNPTQGLYIIDGRKVMVK